MTETKENLGLSGAEAGRRLRQYGYNEIAESKKLSGLLAFLVRFKNPLVLILIFAAVVSALTGDPVGASIIIAIVVISVFLDFFNTYKSQKAAEELKEKVMVTAEVIRDGKVTPLPLRMIVPGDVIELEAGDVIPADGKIILEKDLFLNESSLTGESFPSEKQVDMPAFLGTSVVTGTGRMLVELTGKKTKFSKIAESLEENQRPTEFERSIKDFSYLIMKITFVLVIFIFFVNAILKGGGAILESFLFAAALAVGLTPELLPMIITINLSKGSLAMAKHGVIVKKLSSIQNFGAMDILCTDKTGTLTEDKIELVKYVNAEGQADEKIFDYAFISSSFRSGFKNPLDGAVKEFKPFDVSGYRKIDEIPFDYQRKRDSIIVKTPGGHELVSKGAPEEMFATCGYYKTAENKLTAGIAKKLEAEYQALSKDGFRVLAVAKKAVEEKLAYTKEDEKDLIILGFIAFLDPPKKTVTETLKILENYGIGIKIITGDNELVTQKIAQEIQLQVTGVLVGSEIEKLHEHQLAVAVEKTTIFARVTPDQKKLIIETLQKNNHVVGFMGDGINDAPSLKAADVGISVNNAVDVAKESADLILLHKSLKELVNGVIQGRKTFANTLKYLMMGLSSNFGNMFSMAGASLFFPFLPMLPTQILLNNLLYDGSQFVIPLDNVDDEAIKKPRKMKIHFLRRFMVVFGILSSVFDFVTFFVLTYVFHYTNHAFQTGWFITSFATQILVVFVIRTKAIPFYSSKPAKSLIISVFAFLALAFFFALGPIKNIFGFAPLSIAMIFSALLITLLYLITIEFAKRKFYQRIEE
ncbi:MAG: magnesium-translocating P-type ATPase [Candidatus Doudnabacteria bacterium]|nr:magnesium-translocating P-type ATPase [Candidatus Doudnabacteria bacterium]